MNNDGLILEKNQKGKNKIILAGLTNAGKTSIYDVIFNNVNPQSITTKPTHNFLIHYPSIEIFKKDNLIFIDTGGQRRYIEQILRQKRDFFQGIACLVYVIDIQKEDLFEETLENYSIFIKKITNITGAIPIFILFHKYDPNLSIFEEKEKQKQINILASEFEKTTIKKCNNCILRFYQTSIFDKEALISVVVDVLSYSLLEKVFRSLLGGIFLEESHKTILNDFNQLKLDEPENESSLKTYAKNLGINISIIFKEELAKGQFIQKNSEEEPNQDTSDLKNAEEHSQPKLQELPTRDLEIEFTCPMIDRDNGSIEKNIDKKCCQITHGLLEGIMLTLDYQEVELLQTMIINGTPTCKFRALTRKLD